MSNSCNKYYILGAGSHAVVIAENIISTAKNSKNIFFFDDAIEKNKIVYSGIQVLDAIRNIGNYKNENSSLILGIGDTNLPVREKLFNDLHTDFKFFNSIHVSSVISATADIGNGVFIGANTFIGANVKIGDNSVIYPGSVIEHDCVLERNVYLSPGAVIAGKAVLKDNSFIGTGATVLPKIIIAVNSYIAAGAVVTKNTESGSRYMGVPARIK